MQRSWTEEHLLRLLERWRLFGLRRRRGDIAARRPDHRQQRALQRFEPFAALPYQVPVRRETDAEASRTRVGLLERAQVERQVRRDEAARVERNKLRRVTRVIFDTVGYDLTLQDVVHAVNRGTQSPMSGPEVQRLLEKVLSDLQGSSDLREDGTVTYRFDRLRTERTTAASIREKTADADAVGDVIFDTGPQQLPDAP